MPAVILRILTLVALALMPFGMGTASAIPVHHAATSASDQACDEHRRPPAEQAPDTALDCAIACSMLIVAQPRLEQLEPAFRPLAFRPLSQRGTGLHPETATPPPKLS